MKKNYPYFIIILLSFILYGNTLFHDYALDDAIVITENEYTLSGFDGIIDIFSKKMFDGFFEQKDKNLVAGGRYRPLSVVTFAIEWDLIMGTPFKGLSKASIEKRLNRTVNPAFILPSQKLLKDLSRTIHIESIDLRKKQQELILEQAAELTKQEKSVIVRNLDDMRDKRGLVLFVSHFMNVLFYALSCFILFKVLQLLFANKEQRKWYLSVPFIASLLFLIHPIHTEVVANIKGRDEILSLLGALLAMFFVFKFLRRQRNIYLLGIFTAFLLGLFSKEIAVVFLAIIPISIYFFSDKTQKVKFGLISFIPLLLASAIYFYARHKVLGGFSFEPSQELMNNSFLGMEAGEKYATIFYTLLIYLKLLIFPHPLTYDYYPYHIPVMDWTNLWPILSVVIHLGLGIYALIGLKRKSPVAYGILFYFIALSPVSNILFPIGVFMNERFVYAASIGAVIVFAVLILKYIQNQKLLNTILLLIFVLFSIKTISRNRFWKNDFTLFTHDVKISKNSAKSNTSAGGKLTEEALKPGNSDKRNEYLNQAVGYLHKAIEIHPKYVDAYLLMGNAQWELHHNLDSTFKYYQEILKMNPSYNQVYENMLESKISVVFEDAGKAKSNIRILHQMESFKPNNYKINYYLGRIYGRYLNDLENSLKYLEKASSADTTKVAVFKDLGVVYGLVRQYQKSAIAFEKAIEIDPDDPVLKLNLAMTYANLRDFKNAKSLMDEILRMDIQQKDVHLLVTIGKMYQNMGYADKSMESLEYAKKISPELFKK